MSTDRQIGLSARWAFLSLIPLGLGAWAPVYAGMRIGRRRWILVGALWSAITSAGWVISVTSNGDSAAGGLLLILGWVGAVASSFSMRASYRQAGTDREFDAAVRDAKERLSERERARRLALSQPQLALEMGIGRPDIPGSQDAGVIDINNASETVLETLPGVDATLAHQITETRIETGGFSSVEDLGLALDLDARIVEGLRNQTVFLPRR